MAIGGNLKVTTLLEAYRKGIFPWYNENEPICWYSPDPRFVLFPGELLVSRSMQAVIRKGIFSFSMDRDFEGVIRGCRQVKRSYGSGTWITGDIENAYVGLYREGFAHSAEAWQGNELAGGLYGVRLGRVFFGESMFSLKTNASKFAFIRTVQELQRQGVQLIDCQVYTTHLESLGGRFIPRAQFLELLARLST